MYDLETIKRMNQRAVEKAMTVDNVTSPERASVDNVTGLPKKNKPPETKPRGSRRDPRRGPIQNVLRGLPDEPGARKTVPIMTGVLDYFPLAVAEVARVSKAGNDQHNPGQPLHWARGKSSDHADCIVRHLVDRGTFDADGQRHSAKVAWRALALLQEELEAEAGFNPSEGA